MACPVLFSSGKKKVVDLDKAADLLGHNNRH